MDLLGDSLGAVRDKSTIGVVDMKRIAVQCLERLKELHGRRFVHRDIKPDNLLMGNKTEPHKVYVVDFGLASRYKKESSKARKMYTS